jgi:glutathione synthase/RimK-type ligase-like ATP-grasp enzyme
MILIIGDRRDPHLYPVIRKVQQEGAEATILHVEDFPRKSGLSFALGTRDVWRLRASDGQVISLSDVSSVWFRKPEYPRISDSIRAGEREFVFKETYEALESFYALLRNAFWLNDLTHMRSADHKLTQLQQATRVALRVPRTLVTNEPDLARAFFEECDRKVIYKPMRSGLLGKQEGIWTRPRVSDVIYTTRIDRFAPSDFDRVHYCPALLQEYIEKAFELRVTIVGDQIFAAAIHSQESTEAKTDWRKARDVATLRHEPFALPAEVEGKIRTLMGALSLRYGAMDLIVTPDGEYVFLEVNPNGNFLWIENLTNIPISQAIATCLMARTG